MALCCLCGVGVSNKCFGGWFMENISLEASIHVSLLERVGKLRCYAVKMSRNHAARSVMNVQLRLVDG